MCTPAIMFNFMHDCLILVLFYSYILVLWSPPGSPFAPSLVPFLPTSQQRLSLVLLAPHNQKQLRLLCGPQANYIGILLIIIMCYCCLCLAWIKYFIHFIHSYTVTSHNRVWSANITYHWSDIPRFIHWLKSFPPCHVMSGATRKHHVQ